MQQVDQARQAIAQMGYTINSIGIGGSNNPQPIKQALKTLATAVSSLANAVAEIDQRTTKQQLP